MRADQPRHSLSICGFNEMLIFGDFLKPKNQNFSGWINENVAARRLNKGKGRKRGKNPKMNRRFGFRKSPKISISIK
jgi:hypothetical protein